MERTPTAPNPEVASRIAGQRDSLLRRLEARLELPMALLGFCWLVLFAGAAGMLAFEGEDAGGGLRHYGDALWWTAMLLVTMGSDYWPRTPEGRALCLILATYGFTMFGYITATLGSYFVAADARSPGATRPD